MAQRGDGFQCHVAASLNRLFVELFQKDLIALHDAQRLHELPRAHPPW